VTDEKSRSQDQNPASAKEEAEGSRENLNTTSGGPRGEEADSPMERGSGQMSKDPENAEGRQPGRDQGGGISNRPLEQELKGQRELPPRGESKKEEPGEGEQ
jgi:hypothetical protein